MCSSTECNKKIFLHNCWSENFTKPKTGTIWNQNYFSNVANLIEYPKIAKRIIIPTI